MYDVAIIGAGIIGTSIARALSRYQLSVIVFEKENDVSMGATKANSASFTEVLPNPTQKLRVVYVTKEENNLTNSTKSCILVLIRSVRWFLPLKMTNWRN